uniref:C-type lectin domain-containing protein n=1 Tax=Angiostrongylus cantonensis TaxID=6313 RepID=A0A0K0D1E2_ANGCA
MGEHTLFGQDEWTNGRMYGETDDRMYGWTDLPAVGGRVPSNRWDGTDEWVSCSGDDLGDALRYQSDLVCLIIVHFAIDFSRTHY